MGRGGAAHKKLFNIGFFFPLFCSSARGVLSLTSLQHSNRPLPTSRLCAQVEFDGSRQKYNIKFYFEAAWDDSSDSIVVEEPEKVADEEEGKNAGEKTNPPPRINRWDPRIFFPDMESEKVEFRRIVTDQYQKEFGKPMTAYRFISTMEFRAESRTMANFPFDHHELKIVARSREAEEKRNENVNVHFHENEHFPSMVEPDKKHMAYDAFDFAVRKKGQTNTGKTYLGIRVDTEPMEGELHKGRNRKAFRAVLLIRRRAKDWIIQVGENGSGAGSGATSIRYLSQTM